MGNQLFIGGSKFPHRDIHKYTWKSPDGITRNQIDHFVINRKFLGCLKDVKAIRGADIYSDHQLLVGILRLRPMPNYKKPSARKKFNVHRLQQTSVAQEFTHRLCTELESYQQQPSWKNITEACIKTANDTLGASTHHTSPWIRDATWEKIKERKAIKMELLSAEQISNYQQTSHRYNNVEKQVKKMVRADRRLYQKNIASSAEYSAAHGNTRGTYKAIKQLSGSKLTTTPNIRDINGNILTNIEDQLGRWKEFFETPPVENILTQPTLSATNQKKSKKRHTHSNTDYRRSLLLSSRTTKLLVPTIFHPSSGRHALTS